MALFGLLQTGVADETLAVPLERLLHEGQSRRFVPFLHDEALQDLALVVNSAPQVNHLTVELHVHFIEVPLPMAEAPHEVDALPPDISSEQRAEAIPPKPHRLMAKVDPTLEQQVLDVAQAQRKTHVHHHHKPDVAAEWYQGLWTLRAGFFNLSKVPNGINLESNFSQNSVVVEAERRFHIAGRDGAIRVTAFRNRGRFARFDEALALARATGQPLVPAPVRRRQDRAGIALNAEQDVTANFGLFLRAGVTDGAIETYDFTDIDRTLAIEGSLKGAGWARPGDTFAIAMVANGISNAHRGAVSPIATRLQLTQLSPQQRDFRP